MHAHKRSGLFVLLTTNLVHQRRLQRESAPSYVLRAGVFSCGRAALCCWQDLIPPHWPGPVYEARGADRGADYHSALSTPYEVFGRRKCVVSECRRKERSAMLESCPQVNFLCCTNPFTYQLVNRLEWVTTWILDILNNHRRLLNVFAALRCKCKLTFEDVVVSRGSSCFFLQFPNV